ncbi:MAG: adenine nucleotide alpha hydrolase [Spirochaetales bacterium]|nr:adenine nucleotide alpha hydrolase [Spirochaetales bacterium]
MAALEEVLRGRIPPWLLRLVKQAGRSINRFGMIGADDRILLGTSGGKDSLVLALLLTLRKTWLPIDYDLKALHIDWVEYPMTADEKDTLQIYFDALKIPLEIHRTPMENPSFQGEFNCYLCARNRRRILFQKADELGISKIALGHHLDDFVETILINLCFRGSIESMQPVQDFFFGALHIIRPLCEIPEAAVQRIADRLDLPVIPKRCPHEAENIRFRLKPLVSELSHLDKLARSHIFEAFFGGKSKKTD